MHINSKPMGDYQTNCYIVRVNNRDFIIDPGIDAWQWVVQNVKNPVAIFNTHGHFDHIWSNAKLQETLKIPLYTPVDDVFMLSSSSWMPHMPPSKPDIEVRPNEIFDFDGIKVTFHHYAGHTMGSSMIEIDGVYFSGDFIFYGSIGRTDFPHSDPSLMIESLKRFKELQDDKLIYPGHGRATSVKNEQKYIDYWIDSLS